MQDGCGPLEYALLAHRPVVLIRFTSTLTPADEDAVARPLLRAITAILDALPIAYSIRIETSDQRIYRHSHPRRAGETDDAGDEPDPVR